MIKNDYYTDKLPVFVFFAATSDYLRGDLTQNWRVILKHRLFFKFVMESVYIKLTLLQSQRNMITDFIY